jgi:signal transduction histidine kinase
MIRPPSSVVYLTLLIVLFVVDLIFLPGFTVAIFYAIPVLYAGRSQPPRLTGLLCAVALVLTVVDAAEDRPPPPYWPLSTVGLLLVAFLAIDMSIRRQGEADRERDLNRRVHLAEQMRQPLTVIIGYTQRLQRKAEDEELSGLHSIETAAHRVDELIRQMLANH